MERILVMEKELIDLLNKDLHKTENPKYFRFDDGVTRLVDKDETGCNWADVTIRASGVSVAQVTPLADSIIFEAKKKYNLK